MDDELSRAEAREIELHKYYMSQKHGYDVGYDAARADWLEHYAASWLKERQERMLSMQRAEINRHKWIESEKAQRDLGRDAVLDWVKKHAAKWREWYDRECTSEI